MRSQKCVNTTGGTLGPTLGCVLPVIPVGPRSVGTKSCSAVCVKIENQNQWLHCRLTRLTMQL